MFHRPADDGVVAEDDTTQGRKAWASFVRWDGLMSAMVTMGRVTTDGVGPHTDLLDEFPHLGAPHAVPVGWRRVRLAPPRPTGHR